MGYIFPIEQRFAMESEMKAMLAKGYEGQGVTGWLISEKLDGVRALWDGENLISRNGNVFAAPDWFKAALPAMPLDGELYIDRQMFQTTVGIVRKKAPIDAEWRRLQYKVFDAPSHPGGFEQRLSAAHAALAGNAIAQVIEQTPCTGKAHLDALFASLVAQGAEGLMLRRPGSAYEQKRTDALLKYKPFDTAEARVIGHTDGEGRLAGMVGALICLWKGKQFQVGAGMNDATRQSAPGIGAAITFGFQGLTDGGIPRFPTFVAVRDYE
jgi:DNA ligase-1